MPIRPENTKLTGSTTRIDPCALAKAPVPPRKLCSRRRSPEGRSFWFHREYRLPPQIPRTQALSIVSTPFTTTLTPVVRFTIRSYEYVPVPVMSPNQVSTPPVQCVTVTFPICTGVEHVALLTVTVVAVTGCAPALLAGPATHSPVTARNASTNEARPNLICVPLRTT